MVLATKVMGKSKRSGVWWYYLDEGVYGSFSGKMYDHADYPLFTSRVGPKHNSVLAGPTCDSIDVLYENIALPELQIGDVLLFESMGSYTTASASNFNGFPKAKIVCVD
jgi:ornithine decarboxylase